MENIPTPAREVDVDALQQLLETGERDLLSQIATTRAYLDVVVDGVAKRLTKIHPLSSQFDGAVKRAAHAAGVDWMDISFDAAADVLHDRLGVTALYELAGRLERALPDNCDCSKHGCAGLAGIPTGRAD